jgi:hypothetical protein
MYIYNICIYIYAYIYVYAYIYTYIYICRDEGDVEDAKPKSVFVTEEKVNVESVNISNSRPMEIEGNFFFFFFFFLILKFQNKV